MCYMDKSFSHHVHFICNVPNHYIMCKTTKIAFYCLYLSFEYSYKGVKMCKILYNILDQCYVDGRANTHLVALLAFN